MYSDARRPQRIPLDRFVEALDERLREEVATTRRVMVPMSIRQILRALKIRALAIVQGGAMALTGLAVIIAVGIAPSVTPTGTGTSVGPLAAPIVQADSAITLKGDPVIMAFASPQPDATPLRGLFR